MLPFPEPTSTRTHAHVTADTTKPLLNRYTTTLPHYHTTPLLHYYTSTHRCPFRHVLPRAFARAQPPDPRHQAVAAAAARRGLSWCIMAPIQYGHFPIKHCPLSNQALALSNQTWTRTLSNQARARPNRTRALSDRTPTGTWTATLAMAAPPRVPSGCCCIRKSRA